MVDDVEVISFLAHGSADNEAVFVNKGDGPVFLSPVDMTIEKFGTAVAPINKTIDSKAVPSKASDPSIRETFRRFTVISGEALKKWKEANINASHFEDECVIFEVLSENHPWVSLYSQHYGEERFSAWAKTVLHYYSLESKKDRVLRFSSRVVFVVNPECRPDFEQAFGKLQ